MKLKRLQHAADTLCHMFCGWRLINSYRDLEKLGSGTLRIDAISGDCRFNDGPLEDLSIAGELSAWLRRDLLEHGIPIELLVKAEVIARFEVDQINSQRRQTTDQHFNKAGMEIAKGAFNRFRVRCESEVSTEERAYRSTCEDLEEWPTGWPSA